ncbi:MAG TPA: hypothetical protein DIU09_15610, partial [Hyphomonadaceae bacterium]|nr:hypothetical protein [Hyphomonadaceae bacterium]
MIQDQPYSYPRKTPLKSAAKQVIAALSLTALVASCGSNPAGYTQFAGPVPSNTSTDATDYNCPAPPERAERAYPSRTRMAVGMPAPSGMAMPSPPMAPPPPPPPPP